MKKLSLLISVLLISMSSMAQMYLWKGGHYSPAELDSITFSANVQTDNTFTVKPSMAILQAGYTQQLSLSKNTLPENTYFWFSSNEDVATVNQQGEVTALEAGMAIISATLSNRSQTCIVTVKDIESLYFDNNVTYLRKDFFPLQFASVLRWYPSEYDMPKVVWASSNTNVVTIDVQGTASYVGNGETTISATHGSLTATYDIVVYEVSSISFYSSDIAVKTGYTHNITVYDNQGYDITSYCTLTSDNPVVATVSQDGQVTGISEGTATITAKYGDVTAQCRVSVESIPSFDNSGENKVRLVIRIPEGTECNGIAFKGSFDGLTWSGENTYSDGEMNAQASPENCLKFAPVEGYKNWYTAEYRVGLAGWEGTNEEGNYVDNYMAGKICLIYANDGAWQGQAVDWDYDMNFTTSAVSKSADGNIQVNSDRGVIYIEIGGWQKSDCTPKQTYSVTVKAPTCGDYDMEIIGDFDDWRGTLMTPNETRTVWTATFDAQEGYSFNFKFRQAGTWENVVLVKQGVIWEELQLTSDANMLNLTYDFSDASQYKWTLCPEVVDLGYQDGEISVSKALEAGAKLGASDTTGVMKVRGIVKSVRGVDLSYGTAQFYITENGTNELYCYNIKGLNGDKFVSGRQISVGDTVTIEARLYNYVKDDVSTFELIQGNITRTTNTFDLSTIEGPKVLTVAEAYAEGEKLEQGATTADQYKVAGIITEVTEASSQYGNITFKMKDADGTQEMIAYRLKYIDNQKYTGEPAITVGDAVTVIAQIKNHYGTVEFVNGYISEHVR